MNAKARPRRLLNWRMIPLWVVALLAVAIPVVPRQAQAETLPDIHHPTAQRAMQDYLTYQGQCWPWMRQIVYESTGNLMGFGYVSGFYEGGASEVPLSEAQQGDVIQIADDQNAGPGVDYIGLHTALVLERFEDGTFTVIDSNSKWDGIVRIRYNYDPIASANRYTGLEVHAYRFPLEGAPPPATTESGSDPTSTPTPTASPEPPPPAVQFELGDHVVVSTDSGCLNLRAQPVLSGERISCLAQGTRAVVLSDAVQADGWTWVAISTEDGEAGWVASEYLAMAPASEPDAESTEDTEPVEDTPTSELSPTPSPPAEDEPSPTTTEVPTQVEPSPTAPPPAPTEAPAATEEPDAAKPGPPHRAVIPALAVS